MGLNNKIKEGVEKAGLIGYQFNTVGVRCVPQWKSARICR